LDVQNRGSAHRETDRFLKENIRAYFSMHSHEQKGKIGLWTVSDRRRRFKTCWGEVPVVRWTVILKTFCSNSRTNTTGGGNWIRKTVTGIKDSRPS